MTSSLAIRRSRVTSCTESSPSHAASPQRRLTGRVALAALVAACAVFVSACGPDRTDFGTDAPAADTGDASNTDAPRCGAGQYYCAGSVAHQCDAAGRSVSEVDCRAQGQTCVPLLGCRVCIPNQSQCGVTDPLATQTCSSDGMRWIDGPHCDAARGEMCSAGMCTSRCDRTQRNYLACEYFGTVTANPSLVGANFPFAVVVANPQSYPVNVGISGGGLGAMPVNRALMPGEVATVVLPWVEPLRVPGTEHNAVTPNGAYHIQSDGAIAAYQFSPLTYRSTTGTLSFSYTNDASLLLPTQVLTRSYTLAGWPGGSFAVVGVDGSESATHVRVRTTAPVKDPEHPPTSPFTPWRSLPPGDYTFDVRQGDVLQLVAMDTMDDLTGTVVEASLPVAVFTTHPCADVPLDRHYCDHLEEQLLPNETWGRRAVVTPLADRTTLPSVVRIVSQRNGNALTFDGIPAPPECSGTLDAGRFCEFQVTGNAFRVEGTQPFLALQFMIGQGEPQPQCGDDREMPPDLPECMSDPAMVTEVPLDQFRRTYDFLVPDTYIRSFLNVVVPAGTRVVLDGVEVNVPPAPAGSGYEYYAFPIRPGQHHIESQGGATMPLGIKVYGVAPYTSYMYPGGLNLDLISPPG